MLILGGAVGIRRQEFFELWRRKVDFSKKNSNVFQHLITDLNLTDSEESIQNDLKLSCSTGCSQIKTKWQSSHRILANFNSKNSK
mgnify:CR=1 FL=1